MAAANGGVIMVNQKSGSGRFHGTLFEFFRNEKLNARNLLRDNGTSLGFAESIRLRAGRAHQRNKTFFFADWQGTRLNTGVVRTSTVPPQRKGRETHAPSSTQPQRGRLQQVCAGSFPEQRDSGAASSRDAGSARPVPGTQRLL
jgi:hypothetical protein